MSRIGLKRLLWAAIIAAVLIVASFIGYQGLRLWKFNGIFAPDQIVENFRSMPTIFDSREIFRQGKKTDFATQEHTLPNSFSFQGKEIAIPEWLARTGTTGLMVIHNDKIAHESYFQGYEPQSQAIAWSVSKSFVSALVGIAIADGSIKSVRDPVTDYVPALKGSGYDGVALEDVLEMSSGVAFSEDYADPNSDINKLGEILAFGRSVNQWTTNLKRELPPATRHHYISVDTQVAGMVITAATGKSLSDYFIEKLWSRIGPECDAHWLTDGQGNELAFAGLTLCLRDFAQLGQLYLHNGKNSAGQQVVPEQWVHDSVSPHKAHLLPGRAVEEGQPILGYGYQWWVPQSTEGEYMAVGVYGQFVYVNPTRNVVIAKTSAYANYTDDGIRMEYESIEAFRSIARQIAGQEG
ncbi:serine hydrolase [Pseudomonas sp.]|uniref:serine hydrolase domain-containing protein n=1 Tax=Pseudomonas sp. TaxID=306 RepID=UPI002BED86D2|nr:serine hydrolase [Pseudomonas sp.]HUE91516.1 serine hydrolase [Pseudomonas sp.]